MNVFILDADPKVAASYLNSSHLVKMQLESAQLLSTLARHLAGAKACAGLYQMTHFNHPCSRHLRYSYDYAKWVYENALGMAEEKHKRDGKRYHASWHVTKEAWEIIKQKYWPRLSSQIGYPLAMDKSIFAGVTYLQQREGYTYALDIVCAVEMYRRYYLQFKRHLADWKGGTVPEWWQ